MCSGQCISEIKRNMINRIVAHPAAFFKHQRRDEPDLTTEEKYLIADELFQSFPVKFLERYGRFLLEEDKPCLDSIPSNDATEYLKTIIANQISQKQSTSIIKNRRFKKMEELLKEGEYFSDEEMKSRCPLMYEQMLGKFHAEDQFKPLTGENIFSSFCLRHLDAMTNNELYAKQLEEEENFMECNDTENEEEEEEIEDDDQQPEISNKDKAFLRKQFTDLMKNRFMQGLDENFDYEKIDNDERLDSFDVIERDAEDKYFDDDGNYESDEDDDNDDGGDGDDTNAIP